MHRQRGLRGEDVLFLDNGREYMVNVGRFGWGSEVEGVCEKGLHIEEGREKDG